MPKILLEPHSHSTFSDGKLSIRELIDLYGRNNFGALFITDHLCDDSIIGRLAKTFNQTLTENEFQRYLEVINFESKRALEKYDLIVVPGIEITKEKKSIVGSIIRKEMHFLLVDIKEYISPNDPAEIIMQKAKEQDCLIIMCHPYGLVKDDHKKNKSWFKKSYVWDNIEKYITLIDAWEIVNRNNFFPAVAERNLPFVGSGDFHKKRHLHTFKTLLNCDKNIKSIKKCIRENRHVAITLFKGGIKW